MSKKFGKDRSVTFSYTAVPMYYTPVHHPKYKHKQLVLIDQFGQNYIAAYRNHNTCKVGITFLVKADKQRKKHGFIFKDKFIPLRKCNWVF